MPLMLVVKKKRRTSPAVRFETRDGQAFSPALEESSKACAFWEVCVRASWMRFSEGVKVTVVFLRSGEYNTAQDTQVGQHHLHHLLGLDVPIYLNKYLLELYEAFSRYFRRQLDLANNYWVLRRTLCLAM